MQGSSIESQEADVLVVEADTELRQNIVELLESVGYAVSQAEDGFVAIDRLRSMRLGAVVLDPAMPVLDGISVLDHFDGELPPVVMLSHEGTFNGAGTDDGSPVVAHLRKPGIPPLLLVVIAAAHEASGWRASLSHHRTVSHDMTTT